MAKSINNYWEDLELIQTSDGPYSKIERISISEILGRKMRTKENLNDAINDRLNHAKLAWVKLGTVPSQIKPSMA